MKVGGEGGEFPGGAGGEESGGRELPGISVQLNYRGRRTLRNHEMLVCKKALLKTKEI